MRVASTPIPNYGKTTNFSLTWEAWKVDDDKRRDQEKRRKNGGELNNMVFFRSTPSPSSISLWSQESVL